MKSPDSSRRRKPAPENRSRGLVFSRLRDYRQITKLAEAWYSALTLHALVASTQSKQRIKKTEEQLLRALSSVRDRRRTKRL